MTIKRAKRMIQVRERGGKLELNRHDASTAMAFFQSAGGQLNTKERVPIMYHDAKGKWWWCDRRKLWKPPGCEHFRCSLRGSHRVVELGEVETVDGYIYPTGIVSDVDDGTIYPMPYPLETPQDVSFYVHKLKWNKASSPSAMARRMKWVGPGAYAAALEMCDRLPELIGIKGEALQKLLEPLRARFQFPPRPVDGGEIKPVAKGPTTLERVDETEKQVAELRAELERVNGELQRVNDEIRKLWEAMI